MFKDKSKIITFLTVILTFTVSFVFLYKIRPLGIYDSDDWNYVSYTRSLFPNPLEWNPTRILPETWPSLLGIISSYVVYPIKGDYIQSMTFTLAFFVAAMIGIMGYFLTKLLEKVFGLKRSESMAVWFLFLLGSMLIYRNTEGCQHLFWAEDVTCVFYYTVPGILNAITIMYIWIKNHEKSFKINGVVVFLVYFCINSNMYSSILLVTYLSAVSVTDILDILKKAKRNNTKVAAKDIFKRHLFTVVIDVLWIISIAMESVGGRARMLGDTNGGFNLGDTVRNFVGCITGMNKGWLLVNFVLIAGLLVISIKEKKEESIKLWLSFALEIAVTAIYLILLCAKVSPLYITDSKALFPVLFPIQLLSAISLGIFIKKWPRISVAMPIVIATLVFMVSYYFPNYRHYNVNQLSYEQSKRVNDDILEQIFDARDKGLTEVTVSVPLHPSTDWPLAQSYGGRNVAQALYRHGLISDWMNVTFAPSKEKSIELGVDGL